MQNLVEATLGSWSFRPGLNMLLAITGGLYLRGRFRDRRLLRFGAIGADGGRLTAFLAGLLTLFVALESPLDAFDRFFLSAHMTQHLLLMMVAPSLLLLGDPFVPLLRGLPRTFVKEGLGPFLSWHPLQLVLRRLCSPPVAFLAFVVSTIGWHLPKFYELALKSAGWHNIQHASFFWTGVLFWWPVLKPPTGPASWSRWTIIPYLLLADIANTALSAVFIFSGRVLYPSYETLRLGGISALADQSAAGAIMWVPGSIFYLLPAVVIAARQFGGVRYKKRAVPVRRVPDLVQLGQARSTIPRWKAPSFRRLAQVLMLILAFAVMWDGFEGNQLTQMNLAGVLPWVYWRTFSVLALLFIGNLFCMVCPFTMVRDLARRILPSGAPWPRWLKNKWLPFALMLIYFYCYEAFRIWDKPQATAGVIAGYFATILLVDSIFRGASFCKYVCPIGQFHFVSSLVSPAEIRIVTKKTCQSCHTYDCIRGNDHARGCELGLFQPRKAGNMDCTFCLDCVQACPHQNVTLAFNSPAAALIHDPFRSSIGRMSKRSDIAALSMLMVFGAFVNAASMVSPVMTWMHFFHARWGPNGRQLAVAIWFFGGMVLAPGIAVHLCSFWNRLNRDAVFRFLNALTPLGLSMWTAHLLYHLAAAWKISSIRGVQLLVLDGGLLLTLYVIWRIAVQYGTDEKKAPMLVLPWALLSTGLYSLGVWILFQPMEMRVLMS